MANELQVTCSFTYARGNYPSLSRNITAVNVTVASDPVSEGVLSVLTTETTIPLGSVTLGNNWAYFRNLDSTNYLDIKAAAAGKIIIRLKAGEACLVRLSTDVTAPVAIANTATVSMEFVLFSQ